MSAGARPTPFTLGFGSDADARFAALRRGLTAARVDPLDRDAFLLVREVAQLLHELRPAEGLGAEVEGLTAFVQQAYLFWAAGAVVRPVTAEELALVLEPAGGRDGVIPRLVPSTRYVQLPALKVWGEPRAGWAPEPLDGWFAGSGTAGRLGVLAVFGLHPGRPGLTAVEAGGPRPERLARDDGSALFAPTLRGAPAGLASLTGTEELLELAWRVEALG